MWLQKKQHDSIIHQHSFVFLDLYLIRQAQPTERLGWTWREHIDADYRGIIYTHKLSNAERHQTRTRQNPCLHFRSWTSTHINQRKAMLKNESKKADTLKSVQHISMHKALEKVTAATQVAFEAPYICIISDDKQITSSCGGVASIDVPLITWQILMEEHCASCCKT